MNSTNISTLNYLLILRVLATAAVVFGHASSFFAAFSFTQWPQFPYIQSIAVTFFFLLSGYTIAWIIDTSRSGGTEVYIRFIFDRYMRLTIPLLPVLVLFFIIESLTLGASHRYIDNTSIFTLFGNLFYLQNMVPGVGPFGTNRPLWTISIEFWTYLSFAGLMFGLRRSHFSVVSILVSLVSLWLLWPYVFGGRGAGLPTVWVGGVAVYYFMKHVEVSGFLRLIALPVFGTAVAGMASPGLWPSGGSYSYTYNMLAFVVFFSSVILIADSVLPESFVRVSEWFGSFAYTLYLAHYPVQYLLRKFDLIPTGATGALAATFISYVIAWALSLPFERRYKVIRQAVWNRLRSDQTQLGERRLPD